jgi:hypothetical protein
VTRLLAVLALTFCAWGSAVAGEAYVSSARDVDYRVALDELSLAILDRGYTVVKIQPVDKGLRSKGYQLFEDYKLVFFSSKDLERQAMALGPEMATLLPLKVILYQDKRAVVAAAPVLDGWREVFPSDSGQALIRRIDQDIRGILQQYGGTLHFASRAR